MSGLGGGREGEVREREEREARFFAWDVPGDAHIVALVHERGDAERSATVVDAIATSVARRREHTLLLSAEAGPCPLDELLGGVDSEGLPAALRGRARLSDVAVQRGDRPFVYLPAGPDREAMEALLRDDLLASFVGRVRERGGTLFLVLSEGARLSSEVRGLLDGYVTLGNAEFPSGANGLKVFGRIRFDEDEAGPPDEADPPELLAPLPVAAGLWRGSPEAGGDVAAELLAAEAQAAGRIEAAAPATESEGIADPGSTASVPAAGSVGEEVDGLEAPPSGGHEVPSPAPPAASPLDADPTPSERSPPRLRLVEDDPEDEATVDLDPAAEEGSPPSPEHAAPRPRWARHREGAAFPAFRVVAGAIAVLGVGFGWWWIARAAGGVGGGAATLARPESPAPGAPAAAPDAVQRVAIQRAFGAAPELAYSVLIASYADRDDAALRVARLRSRPLAAAGVSFFTAPTPVRGLVYHRVFAGALPDRAAAETLMLELVVRGDKDEAGAWHLRPTRLAFDLGVYADRAEASSRMAELEDKGIPTYVVAASLDADSVFQVYGGAYETERASLPMAELLAAAGEQASLISRRGMPLPSSPNP